MFKKMFMNKEFMPFLEPEGGAGGLNDTPFLVYYSTEAKFFEHLASILDTKSQERIVILSEKHMCKSCQYVMKQFQAMFPDVEIVLIHGKRNYNNSDNGLKTWKYRKKMERKK